MSMSTSVPDPEEDFDGFMDSLPNSLRTKLLTHMRDGDSNEVRTEVQAEADLYDLFLMISQAAVDGDKETYEKGRAELHKIATGQPPYN